MNTGIVTTGILPLIVGSVEVFQLQAFADVLPWNLAGGTVTLNLIDPNGAVYSYPATISGGSVRVTWTVLNVTGTWRRSWTITDSSGVHQVSRPIVFEVQSSP